MWRTLGGMPRDAARVTTPDAYSCYTICEGDQPMIVIPEGSTVSLPRGFFWDLQLSIDLLGARLTHYEHL